MIYGVSVGVHAMVQKKSIRHGWTTIILSGHVRHTN